MDATYVRISTKRFLNATLDTGNDFTPSLLVRSLLELSLDGNPVANHNSLGSHYQTFILQRLPSLLHLDLRRVRVNKRDQPYPDADNCVLTLQSDGGDAVFSRSPSMSQSVAATGGGGAVCKNSHTLPDLSHGNGSQASTNEQGIACDPPHIRASPGNTGTAMGKRDAKCQEREGKETATPRPHEGSHGSCRTCCVGKNKVDVNEGFRRKITGMGRIFCGRGRDPRITL